VAVGGEGGHGSGSRASGSGRGRPVPDDGGRRSDHDPHRLDYRRTDRHIQPPTARSDPRVGPVLSRCLRSCASPLTERALLKRWTLEAAGPCAAALSGPIRGTIHRPTELFGDREQPLSPRTLLRRP
jgi:hypothetical protein